MRHSSRSHFVAVAVALAILIHAPATGVTDVDFVRDVRPIFQNHCYACHGEAKQESGLRLDLKAAAFQGGDNYGVDIVPGNPHDSPLIELVTASDDSSAMPPSGEPRLSPAEIAILTRWIDEGAIWPDGVDLVATVDKLDHWSFKPLADSSDATFGDSSHESLSGQIDHFVDAKLAEVGLRRSPPADPTSLIRRLSYDLIGLPPTPERVREFIAEYGADSMGDRSSPAIERLVDELLASPRYGERWAQHWLDVVRYADTHGFEVNTERPHAWPYRDYVIRAFNGDTPYDRFIQEQLVGDVLGEDAATGFLVTASVLLPGQIGQDEPSKRLARQDAIDEIVNNIGQTFLGLSIGCARCHDHKFDPITARDYYAMQAFVAGVEYLDRDLSTPEAAAAACGVITEGVVQKVFGGVFRQPDVIHLLNRGDPEQPGEEVLAAVPKALGNTMVEKDCDERDRRKALADWIASSRNPLTARVMVNRIWQGHFGVGLVETASDFGRGGVKPSHPELLDWLAGEFIRGGWSIKRLHRLIVLSATYQQQGNLPTETDQLAAAPKDTDVRLLWRFPSRRLDAETIRDSILAVSGRLNLKMYGPGFDLFDQRGGLSGFHPVESFPEEGLRRMVYAHRVRRERDAVFGAFDCPDGGQSAARRRDSTTPIQALNLFNSRFTLEQSEAFAERVAHEVGGEIEPGIAKAYQLALGREPSSEELRDVEPLVREHGLTALCRALFNSNEFLFVP